jgi:hypothetical protein
MSALFACGDNAVMSNLLVMAKSFVASLTLIALGMPAPAAAAAPAPLILKPTSAWQVDYADERCRLARQFGEGKQTVLLFMDRFGPSEYFRLTIAGQVVKTFVEKGDADIQFGPTEEEQQLAFLKGNLGKEPALVFSGSARIAPPSAAELMAIKNRGKTEWVVIQPISEDRQKAVRHLRVGKPLRKPVMLETGSMRAPFAALDTCIDNLLTSWGVDVERHKTLSRTVTPLKSPDKWIMPSDYPNDMLSAGQPALVSFRLSIGPDGVPTACHIQATTRPKEFDNAVCKSVMRRARFSPALDAQGQPLASYYQNNVYFALP